MAEVNIVLTFDDGPHPSRTERVLATLDAPGNDLDPIKAAFFVQTHAKPGHMTDAHGRGLVKQAYEAGHLIGIHTGSELDHRCHRSRVKQPKNGNSRQGVTLAEGISQDLEQYFLGLRI